MDRRERKTRNWFQWMALSLLSRGESHLETDTPDANNYLPPELVENILLRAREDSLYACRLVNRQWNSVASKELERRNLLHWTSWEVISDYGKILHSPFSPSVFCLERFGKSMHSRVSLPLVISTSKEFSTNPFPTNSLTIWMNSLPTIWNRNSFPRKLQGSMRWDKFFCKYGHFLTELTFHYYGVTLWQLKQTLIHTPNLQVLALSIDTCLVKKASVLKYCDADRIIISRHLTTVQIKGDCKIYLADWLLRLCDHQLVKLFITTENEQLLRCVSRRKFEKLKRLRIYSKCSTVLCEIWHGASHPELEYLFIDMVFHQYDIDTHYNIYMDFIGQFSSTLVHLYMNMAPVYRGYFGYLKEKGIIFSKVRSLTLRRNEGILSWEGTQAKEDAEVLFPNVTYVNFVDVEDNFMNFKHLL
ncbi:unnamed protein product [Orchesella dallaii]|uniref:F-box domain-containing protein n=1 Tax=Orchesella dallaii TaxID=48710 RepID=A0ABP1RVQ2_9HEXA